MPAKRIGSGGGIHAGEPDGDVDGILGGIDGDLGQRRVRCPLAYVARGGDHGIVLRDSLDGVQRQRDAHGDDADHDDHARERTTGRGADGHEAARCSSRDGDAESVNLGLVRARSSSGRGRSARRTGVTKLTRMPTLVVHSAPAPTMASESSMR